MFQVWRTPFTRSSVCQSERAGTSESSRGADTVTRSAGYNQAMINMLYDVLQSCLVEIVLQLPKVSTAQLPGGDSTAAA